MVKNIFSLIFNVILVGRGKKEEKRGRDSDKQSRKGGGVVASVLEDWCAVERKKEKRR